MPQDFASQIRQPMTKEATGKSRASVKHGLHTKTTRYVWLILGVIAVVSILALMLQGQQADASIANTHEEWLKVATIDSQQQGKTSKVVLKSGDTAISALGRLGYPVVEVIAMMRASKPVFALKKVQAGHVFRRLHEQQSMHVYYDIDAERRLHLSSQGDVAGWAAEIQSRSMTTRRLRAFGDIEDSLFVAAAKAGMDSRTTMNLVDIFSWDIDFAREIRKGDQFTVLYEEQFDDAGKMVGSVILAAEFVNQGKSYQAIRYTLANGRVEYFTANGRSMRKTYLKSPVKYSRISSRFSHSRKHPVLGYTRAHRGVDYAASSGTPIRAIGDGRVVYAGRKGGYGRYVKIQHNNANHATAYAHLRRYGRGIRTGKRVKQGQIIGYVGMSGLATGPHLHFEFQVRGRAINPLSVRHPPAKPVPRSEMVLFKAHADIWVRRMDKPILLATWG